MSVHAVKSKLVKPPSSLDVERVRADFPILKQKVHGKPLVYLDNAASAQMPRPVIDRMVRYQTEEHANIHRAVHTLSGLATKAYEESRAKIKNFLNAKEDSEIVFTRGTTDGINLVMHGFGRAFIQEGDEIILSAMEHHSNIVPWQMLTQEKGAKLKIIPMNQNGELLIAEYEKLFTKRTKFVSLVHVSNALGTINPVAEMIRYAKRFDVPVLLDGAQAIPHMTIDVQALDCDFYAFSSHKVYGPTGIGALYAKREWLEKMQPFEGGGDMILSVTFDRTTYNTIPYKFEAGTPPIAAAVGLGAAIDYVTQLGYPQISAHEQALLQYAMERLQAIKGIKLIGTAKYKASVVSFVVDGIHPHDVGTLLDEEGIAVRTGHHCAQPIMEFFGIPATVRASFACYSTFSEIDALVAALQKIQKMFS